MQNQMLQADLTAHGVSVRPGVPVENDGVKAPDFL